MVPNAALTSCPSSKLVLEQLVPAVIKADEFVRHETFANPEFQSKRKRHATPFGAGYTEYPPAIIYLNLFVKQNICVISLLKAAT